MSNGYEKKDINVTISVLTAIFVVLAIILSILFLKEYFMMVKEDIVYEATLKPESPMLLKLRAAEDSILTSYGLTESDSLATTYRIPLEKAMELTAEQALEN